MATNRGMDMYDLRSWAGNSTGKIDALRVLEKRAPVRLRQGCPLACKKCECQLGPFDVSTFERVRSRGYTKILLYGGEPCLRPNLPAIIGAARATGLSVDLLTSGVVLGRHLARRLAEFELASIRIVLDGPPNIHDRRRGKGAFVAGLTGLRTAMMAGLTTDVHFRFEALKNVGFRQLYQVASVLPIRRIWVSTRTCALPSVHPPPQWALERVCREVLRVLRAHPEGPEVVAEGPCFHARLLWDCSQQALWGAGNPGVDVPKSMVYSSK